MAVAVVHHLYHRYHLRPVYLQWECQIVNNVLEALVAEIAHNLDLGEFSFSIHV